MINDPIPKIKKEVNEVYGGSKDTLAVRLTKEQLVTKPLYSPVPEKWIKKVGM